MRKSIAAIGVVTLLLASGPLSLRAEAKEPAEAAVKKGMALTDALKMLKDYDIVAKESMGAYASDDPKEQLKIFIVRPQFESADALMLYATAKIEEDSFSIESLCWYVQWDEDGKLPRGMRAYRQLELQSIDLKVLLPNEKAKGYVPRTRREENPFE
jgi:hypothetical protein